MKYGRFYALLGKVLYMGDGSGFKDEIVSDFTHGRTTHVHEMTEGEYRAACEALESFANGKEALRKARSRALHLMQNLGIDTADWTRINAFCSDKRIAGVEFRALDVKALEALAKKLRGIARHGGLNGRAAAVVPAKKMVYIPDGCAEA